MATASDFYVQPADVSQGLSGLSSTMGMIRQERAREAEVAKAEEKEAAMMQRVGLAKEAAQKAMQSGDPEQIAAVSLEFPEIGAAMTQSMGIIDSDKKTKAADFARSVITAGDDPQAVEGVYRARIKEITDRGGDPTNSVQSFMAWQQNPAGERANLESRWAWGDADGYKAFSGERKAEREAAAKVKAAQVKADTQARQFERQEAGRNSRAARNAAPGTNGKPTAGMQDFQYFQDLKKTDPAGAEAFGRERGFISKEGQELSGHLQKRLSTATDDAIAAERNVGKFVGLADEIERSDLSGGMFGGKWSETIKDVTGEQDAVSNLRREYNAIKGSQVVSNLPPGAASDKDIELALGGFPTDNASKEQLSGFLRGLSKIQQYNADFNNFKAEYISDTGNERGMIKAWKARDAAPATAESDGAWEIVE
jgi:hypothetical protein